MTPEQRLYSRMAIGLPNETGRSRGNRFLANPPGPHYAAFAAMVALGLARFDSRPKARFCFFALTRAGAERALDPGETLDPADFPPIGQD